MHQAIIGTIANLDLWRHMASLEYDALTTMYLVRT